MIGCTSNQALTLRFRCFGVPYRYMRDDGQPYGMESSNVQLGFAHNRCWSYSKYLLYTGLLVAGISSSGTKPMDTVSNCQWAICASNFQKGTSIYLITNQFPPIASALVQLQELVHLLINLLVDRSVHYSWNTLFACYFVDAYDFREMRVSNLYCCSLKSILLGTRW